MRVQWEPRNKRSAPNETCSEPPRIGLEQWLAGLRFDGRDKLASLPNELMGDHDGRVIR
jgi:hypothetical protein